MGREKKPWDFPWIFPPSFGSQAMEDAPPEKVDVIFVPGGRLMAAVAASVWAFGLVEEPKVGGAATGG